MATIKATLTKFGAKGDLLDPKLVQRAVSKSLDKVEKAVKADYDSTTRTWKHKAKATSIKESESSRFVYVADDVHQMLDVGTRPHTIRPRTARRLAFRGGFRAKTSPGVIGSNAGGSYGAYVYANEVRHPGTKPRRWTDTIARKRDKDLQNGIDQEIANI